MEILLVSSSNSIAVDVSVLRTSKHGESNTYVLEDLTLYAGNPVKEILLNWIYLTTEIFKSFSLRSLSSLTSCDLVSWYRHAHYLESLITISLDSLCLDNLDIFKEDLENQRRYGVSVPALHKKQQRIKELIRRIQDCMTRSSTKELFTPFKDPEREFRLSMKEKVAETMAETMEEYMSKTRADYGSGVTMPKIDDKDHFELKGQFLKELQDNTFSGSNHED
ncbi:hypothetical protein Tco_0201474 [Tanacetum coccineum]